MSLTIEEMVQRVGEDLSLVAIGQALESQDESRITNTYNEVYERIKKKGRATWNSTGDIPTVAVPYVALMMCEKLLTSYSVPEARANRIRQDAGLNGDVALSNLSEMTLPEYESTTEASDY